VVGLGIFVLLAATAWASEPVRKLGVQVPMRDGVRLSANVFLPRASEKFPVILARTPYGKGAALTPAYHTFVDRGYGVMVQDVRGRYASEGQFRPLDQESNDGFDTLTWIAKQPWSNGRIGMVGGSYLGIVQWKVAVLNHPNLKAISPVVSGWDDYRDRFYSRGGAFKLGHRMLWVRDNYGARGRAVPDLASFIRRLPLRAMDQAAAGETVDLVQRALDHPDYDAFWKSISTRERIDHVRIPVLSFAGWYDNFVQSDLEAFAALRRNGVPARIVVGPWPHNMSIRFEGVDFGKEAGAPVRRMQIEWFDHWLKDQPLKPQAPARLFLMGANTWREENEWPPARAQQTAFYLHGRESALRRRKPGEEAPRTFVYDPKNPVPTLGGAVCCNPAAFPWGPRDQRPVEGRPDVLVYTSNPLRNPLEVTGSVQAMLWVSTSAPDTDFTAKLVDVAPSGMALNLIDGILRLRYRNSLEKEEPATPGEVYRIAVDMGVTSHLFQPEHRIRVEISSSNFPRFDRNPNTGRAIAAEMELRTARQTVYQDRARPSHVILPVIRDERLTRR
jgi:uncharacterized protein